MNHSSSKDSLSADEVSEMEFSSDENCSSQNNITGKRSSSENDASSSNKIARLHKSDAELNLENKAYVQIECKLVSLLKSIETYLKHDKLSEDDYKVLNDEAMSAHIEFVAYSQSIELGNRSICFQETDETIDDITFLDANHRSKLCGIGKQLWSLVCANPNFFYDFVSESSSILVDKKSKNHERESQDPIIREEESLSKQKLRAASSGHIRAISARLILIDSIITCHRNVPKLRFHKEQFFLSTKNERSEEQSMNQSDHWQLLTKASEDLEFGIKSFSRAGRSILAHSSSPQLAYSVLSLAADCWESINEMVQINRQKNENTNEDTYDKISTIKNQTMEHAFETYMLLPDAASSTQKLLVVEQTEIISCDESNYQTKCSSDDIIRQLQRVEHFVLSHETANDRPNQTLMTCESLKAGTTNLLLVQLYYPSIAQLASKYGHYFAKLSEYGHSRKALQISLGMTNR